MDAESVLYDELERMGSGGEIKNPTSIWGLLSLFPQLSADYQQILVEQLEKIARSLLHNPNLLANWSKEPGKEVLNEFISLSIKTSDIVQQKLMSFIEIIVSSVGVKKSNMQHVFQYLTSEDTNEKELQTSIKILQILISLNRPPAPYSYFYFSGPGSGFDLNYSQNPGFAFQKGLAACFWLRVEEVNSEKPSRLMLFHSKGNGGMEAYFIKNKLYYRTIGPEYTYPELGSNGIFLHEFPPETWVFLGIEHEKSKIRKSVLKIVIDGEEIMSPPMDFPVFKSQNPEFSQAGLCLEFTGQLACAMIFTEAISVSSMKNIYSFYTWAPQGHEALRTLHRVIDKNLSKNLFCFYHPLRISEKKAYDGIGKYDANMLGLTGSKQLTNTRMNYLGGICALLPIVEKISGLPTGQNFLLTEWIRLVVACLKDRPENQIEACKMKFFKALAEILVSFPSGDIREEVVNLLEEMNNFIMPQLRDQMTLYIMWLPEFWSKTQPSVQSHLFKVLKVLYTKAPKQISKTVGVQKMLEVLQEYYSEQEQHIKEIVGIIEVVLLGNGENIAFSITFIVSVLFAKSSNLVQVQLLQLLKKLLNDRPGDIVSASSSVFAKFFLEANGLEMLLLLLSSGCFEVRGLCLSLIDNVLSSNEKVPTFCARKDVFTYISSIILPFQKLMSGSFKPLQLSLGSLQGFSDRQTDEVEDLGKIIKSLKVSEMPKSFGFTSPKEDLGINPPPAPSSKKKISFMFPDVGKAEAKAGLKKNLEIASESKEPTGKLGKKGFNFNFDDEEVNLPSLTERSLESEEEKREDFNLTLQNPKKTVKSFSQTRKFVPKLTENLLIDTDKINENFTFGGEKGAVKTETTEEENLIQEIKEMAQKCVKYMSGELEASQDFMLLPVSKFNPPTCRGKKLMDFPLSATKNYPEIIEEVSLDMSSSSFLTSPRKKEEEKVYHAILEMVLKRNIEGADILDDSDTIQSLAGLAILQDIVSKAGNELKHKAMQDLMMLTKWNSNNASVLSKNNDWHYWLLEILLECGEFQDTSVVISDIGHRLHTIVMKQAILADEEGWKYLRRVIYWLESKKNQEKPRGIVRSLLEKLNEALQSNSMGCRPCLESTFWKNLITTGFLIEEFLTYSEEFAICPEEVSLLETYIQLLDPIWPEVLFEERGKLEEDHLQLIKCIDGREQGGFKADIQILIFEPLGELKSRGWFIKNVLHLSCLALKSTQCFDPWLSVIDRIIKFILLVSESSKKQLSNSAIKVFTSSVIYSLGFLVSMITEETGQVRKTLRKILKYIFSIYVHTSKKYNQGGLKNIFKSGFQSMNVCEEVVLFLMERLSEELDLPILEKMMDQNFSNLDSLINSKKWQNAILEIYQPVQDSFENKLRMKGISGFREKIAEKLNKDKDFSKKQSEEANVKLSEFLQEIANEKQLEEESKIKLRLFEKIESNRQRKHMWRKRKRLFTEWRGAWHVQKEYRLEPSQTMDNEYCRGLLRVSSENYKYLQGCTERIHDEIEFNSEILVRDKPMLADEEDSEYADEENTSRVVGKNIEGKESTLLKVNVGLMQPLTTKYGTLQVLVTKKDQKIKFTYEEDVKNLFNSSVELFKYVPSEEKSSTKEWKIETIVTVMPHSFVMQQTAAEFFFEDGRSLLVQFLSQSERLSFLTSLKKLQKSAVPRLLNFKSHNPLKLVQESGMTEKWANWQISNFEYLMYLNFASGRSYNDLSQYPILPWVLNNYTADSIDLNSKSSYRDLSKNMGSLGNTERLKYFKDRYANFPHDSSEPAFHFGSHYSNPGIVLSFLIRLFPYSEGAKELQGGKFDLPDRIFRSVVEAYSSATEDISDVRELIPEFFFLPEILVNREQFNFGRTQQGDIVNDVELPKWAKDAYDFIRINKEALESEYVSENLHKWIDLIFGYKQQGKEAENAMNMFYYLTYENRVDLDKIADPALKRAIETQIVQFGKTPSQLFVRGHPSRKLFSKLFPSNTLVNKDSQVKIYLPAHRKPFAKPLIFYNYYDISERGIIKAKMFKDKEIVAIRNNGNIIKFSWWSEPMGECKTPFTCASNVEFQLAKEQKAGTIESCDRSIQGLNAPIEIIQQGKVIIRGGFWDGRLSIRKTSAKEESTCRWNHHSTITCIEVDELEKHAITGGKEGDVFLWQVEGEHLHPRWNFIDHNEQVTSVAISSHLHIFASCSLDGTCNLYSLRKGRLIRVVNLPNNAPANIVKISQAAPAKIILFSSALSGIFTYSVNGAELCRVQEKVKLFSSALVITDMQQRDFLIYGCENGEIIIRNAGTLALIRKISLTAAAPVLTIILTSDLKFLLAGCADGELTVVTDPTI